jgi:hypothetical protein
MILIAIVIWLICGIGAAMVASSKGRDTCGWFFIGVLIGPFALLVVGFMAPASKSSVGLAPDEEVIYSQDNIKVTNRRLFSGSYVFAVKDLRPVEVQKVESGKYAIQVSNLAGDVIHTITSSNRNSSAKIGAAINQAVQLSSLSETPKPQPYDTVDALTEMKRLLDSGLVTQDEYDQKKAEILSRL